MAERQKNKFACWFGFERESFGNGGGGFKRLKPGVKKGHLIKLIFKG